MFHNKKYSCNPEEQEGKEYYGMKIASKTKVLGYMFDCKNNNLEQIKYIKKKITKAQKI